MEKRFLALASQPTVAAEEIEWINSRTRILGEPFSVAVESVAEAVKMGFMIVVDVRLPEPDGR